MYVAVLPFPMFSVDCTPRTKLTGKSITICTMEEEEEAWESDGNAWNVSPTFLELEWPLPVYKGFMCVALLPFTMFSFDCTGLVNALTCVALFRQ